MREFIFLFAYEFIRLKNTRKKRAFKAERDVPRDNFRAFGGVRRFAFIGILAV